MFAHQQIALKGIKRIVCLTFDLVRKIFVQIYNLVLHRCM